ncbi:MAG TPA: hypothetical protein VGD99_24190, partial [Anaerolineae bacterium]
MTTSFHDTVASCAGSGVAMGETQMVKTTIETRDDLAYLRAESLRPVLFGVLVALYLWYLILFQP